MATGMNSNMPICGSRQTLDFHNLEGLIKAIKQ